MRTRTACLVLLGTISLPPTLSAAEPLMKEGLWEISASLEVPEMPFKPPPSIITHCYGKEEVKNDQLVLPQEQGGDCRITDLQRSTGKVAWKVTCTGKSPGRGEGEVVFRGYTAYEGNVKLNMENTTMKTRYQARRTGECK